MDNILLDKLLAAYEKHDSLIVGVDFDDTIFPLSGGEQNIKRCEKVVTLLGDLSFILEEKLIICLYSVADEQSLVYKKHIMECYGLTPDYVNESPLDSKWNSKKPFFNILLDDKCGLSDTIETLEEFLKLL